MIILIWNDILIPSNQNFCIYMTMMMKKAYMRILIALHMTGTTAYDHTHSMEDFHHKKSNK